MSLSFLPLQNSSGGTFLNDICVVFMYTNAWERTALNIW